MSADSAEPSREDLAGYNLHSMTAEQALSYLKSGAQGLDDLEVSKRQDVYGRNELGRATKPCPFAIFAKQFVSPLVIILVAATLISAFLGETLDAIIIVIIVVLASVVSFVQEYRSERALEALRQITSPTSLVLRNGSPLKLNSIELVPGDILMISQGDKVAADCRLLESFSLQANEASLTGESMPVEKSVEPCPSETPVPDRTNTIFAGTVVTLGRAKAVVFATGSKTELGKIAMSVQTTKRQKTPFELRMSQVGRLLSAIMIFVVVGITFLGVYRGYSIVEMLIWGLSVAVAAIPEALPAVIATSLTLGVYKMAQKNAVVRRLPAVETLGNVDFICSDKTGTLTTGKMTARKIYVDESAINLLELAESTKQKQSVQMLARASALCNDTIIRTHTDNQARETPEPIASGDPTEIALAAFANIVTGSTKDSIDAQFPRVFEVPFSSERKLMTTVHRIPHERKILVVTKGAPEVVLGISNKILNNNQIMDLDAHHATMIMQANDKFASEGLRVLATSFKELADGDSRTFVATKLERGMNFVGLVGLMDPPRQEAIEAILECKRAGIQVTMITGDNKVTAQSIAKELGIASDSQDAPKTLTGTDLDSMDDTDLAKAVSETRVFARVLPEHKLRITTSLQKAGHIVAMTGDGINDAPALKAANIGVAMGVTGTQVAKESASMILADDNFATIVTAVGEGRRIMDNVRKYLVYLLSANIGEVILFSSSLLLGLPTPLLAKHILYLNLATDGSPAIALAAEPAEPDIMSRPPQRQKSSIFSGTLLWLAGVSILLGSVSLVLFWYVLDSGGWSTAAEEKARTMVFGLVIFFEISFAYSSRSFRNSFVKMGLLRNKMLLLAIVGESAMACVIMTLPPLQEIFSLVSLAVSDWALILLLAPSGFVYTEVTKAIIRARTGGRAKFVPTKKVVS